jgi:hypothetical protein
LGGWRTGARIHNCVTGFAGLELEQETLPYRRNLMDNRRRLNVSRVSQGPHYQAVNGHWAGSRLHAVQRSLASPRGTLAQISSGISMLNADISFSTPP